MINKDEFLFVVDERNQPVEAKPREEVHRNEHWHRNANVWIVNSKGQILCQQRSLKKDSSPGKWEPFFGGHVLAEEGYEETAIKECNEELGLGVRKEDLFFINIHQIGHTREFVAVYMMEWNGDIDSITYEEDEVNQLAWFEMDELKRMLLESKDDEWTRSGFEEEIFSWLQKKSKKS